MKKIIFFLILIIQSTIIFSQGFSVESLGLKMPVDVVIDYMHACLEGMGKQWLKLWLKSTNSRFAYYLGPRLSQMDTILNATRYPIEFPRSQRSLEI